MKKLGIAFIGMGVLLLLTWLLSSQRTFDRGGMFTGTRPMPRGFGLVMGIIWIVAGVVVLLVF